MWAIVTFSDPVNDGVRYYGNLLALFVQWPRKSGPETYQGKLFVLMYGANMSAKSRVREAESD
jgi:hypothetical protein